MSQIQHLNFLQFDMETPATSATRTLESYVAQNSADIADIKKDIADLKHFLVLGGIYAVAAVFAGLIWAYFGRRLFRHLGLLHGGTGGASPVRLKIFTHLFTLSLPLGHYYVASFLFEFYVA